MHAFGYHVIQMFGLIFVRYTQLSEAVFGALPQLRRNNSPLHEAAFDDFEEELMYSMYKVRKKECAWRSIKQLFAGNRGAVTFNVN